MQLDQRAIMQRIGRAGRAAQFGPAGQGFLFEFVRDDARIIVTLGAAGPTDRADRVHASISRPDRMPSYEDLTMLHHAVWGDDGYAYQVFAPRRLHVNIHEHALHLWGLHDGSPELPEFGIGGSI